MVLKVDLPHPRLPLSPKPDGTGESKSKTATASCPREAVLRLLSIAGVGIGGVKYHRCQATHINTEGAGSAGYSVCTLAGQPKSASID